MCRGVVQCVLPRAAWKRVLLGRSASRSTRGGVCHSVLAILGDCDFMLRFGAPFHAFIERLHTLRVDVSPFPPVSLLVHPHSGLFRPVRRHEGFLGRIPFLWRPLSGCAAPEVAALRSMDMEWNGRALPESQWGHAGLALVHVA